MPATGTRPVAIDLFAGAGGLSLGLEQAGFDMAAAVEYDPVHAAVHEHNFPRTAVVCRSAAEITPEQLRAAARSGMEAHGRPGWDGQIDLIAGGPPCQGFSHAGLRQVGDDRNGLVLHFWRLVDALRPTHFLMENVPAMASGTTAAVLAELIARMEASGYAVRPPQVLSAADFGVPQNRRRLILLGTLHGHRPALHPVPSTRRADRPAAAGDTRPAGPTVRDALAGLPDPARYPELLTGDSARLRPDDLAVLHAAGSAYARRLAGLDDDPDDRSARRPHDPALLTGSARTEHGERSSGRFAATEPGRTEPVSRYHRLHPDGLANTLRAGTGAERGAHTSPRPVHPALPRVITVREGARLHSFPDAFRLHATKWHGFRQIGNSVPPLLGRALGQSVVAALGSSPARPDVPAPAGDKGLLVLTMTLAGARYEGSASPGGRTRRPAPPPPPARPGDPEDAAP